MNKLIILSALITLFLAHSTFARDYKKDEVIKQEMGVSGVDANQAIKGLMAGCMGLPFIENKLAELIGVTDISYEPMHNEIMAFGTCAYKIKMDLVESKFN